VHGHRTRLELSKSYGWGYGDVADNCSNPPNLPIHKQNIEIYSGDLNKLVNERLKPNYRNVWLVGGAMLAKDFIRLKLADEIRLSVCLLFWYGTLFF